MAAVHPTGNYDTAVYALTDGAEHTIFTVAGYRAVLITQIWCVEIAGGARTISVKARIGGVDYVLVPPGAVIAAAGTYDAECKPLVLKNGELLKATASASTVNVFVAFIGIGRTI